MRVVVSGPFIAWSVLLGTGAALAQPRPPDQPQPAPSLAPAPRGGAVPDPEVSSVLTPLVQAPPSVSKVPPVSAPPSSLAPAPTLRSAEAAGQLSTALSPDRDRSALATDGHPLAGWHNGLFYLRDANDNFRLYLQGRSQIDAATYFGPGVSGSALKSTILLRSARVELSGEFLKYFNWAVIGEFGRTSVDNTKGTNETFAAAPGQTPTAATARYSSAQTASFKAAPSDVFLNFRADRLFNLQLGQFDAPFTLENRTSSKYYAFMENSLAVRAIGVPNGKEIGLMAWGETSGKHLSYALGPFLGDGTNRLNADNNADFFGRVFVQPLAGVDSAVQYLQLGASLHAGARDSSSVNYDAPTMTTSGNYAFWSPTYTSSRGLTHIIPAGKQLGVAGEVRVPISIVDLTGEVVYVNNGTREALDGYQAANTERFGSLHGYSYYVQFGIWPLGNRDINGRPGYENPPHVDFAKQDNPNPPHALQLLAKWEQLNVSYDSASRNGTADAKNADGAIKVNVFSLGANYWFTKHIRFSVNYGANMFPGAHPQTPSVLAATGANGAATPASVTWNDKQRAVAPGNAIAVVKGGDNSTRDSANLLHEVLFRVAVAL